MQTSQGNILIVEDDPILLETLREGLADEGYFIITAKDGVEAISLLHLVKYDLILLDLNMPRVDGREVVSIIRNLSMRTPIVMMSGRTESRHVAITMDIEAYLTKPFDFEVMFSVVEDCIKRSRSIDSGLIASK